MEVEQHEPAVTVEEQLYIDDQVPLKNESSKNKKISTATESVEKTFVAQRTSIERSSPPSFKNEVNNFSTKDSALARKTKLLYNN